MNCQIISIESNLLVLEFVTTRNNSNFCLDQIVEIDKAQYIKSKSKTRNQKPAKSFGKIIELSAVIIKLQIFKPELYVLGKIIKLISINRELPFLPFVLNKVLVFGENFELDADQLFEFIPTVLINQQVVQGQKIGYINYKTNSEHNFKYWILAHKNGKINKIDLGEYKIGQQVAIIDKSNLLLGSRNKNTVIESALVKSDPNPKSISILKNQCASFKILAGQSNLVIDQDKKLFDMIDNQSDGLENTVFIFVTQDQDFVANINLRSITIWDKYNLGQALKITITDVTSSISEIGYDVIIITQQCLHLNCIGKHKTINGENVHTTIVTQDCKVFNNQNHFDNVLTISQTKSNLLTLINS